MYCYIHFGVFLHYIRTNSKPVSFIWLIRCVQLGLSLRDLDLLTIGTVNDMYTEMCNDDYDGYSEIATQEQMDMF